MSDTGPEVSGVSQEEETRKETMQEMAQEILSEAQKVAETYKFSKEPKSSNFTWMFFATDLSKVGTLPSVTALKLQALAEGKKPPIEEDLERRISQTEDEEEKARLQNLIDKSKNEIFVSFSGLNMDYEGLSTLSRHQPGDKLTNQFLQDLGFVEPNQTVEQSQNGKRKDKGYSI